MRYPILVISFLLVTSTLQGKIVFDSSRDGNLEIYTMNSAGENQTRLTDYEESDFFPVWSPNGQQMHSLDSYSIEGAIRTRRFM